MLSWAVTQSPITNVKLTNVHTSSATLMLTVPSILSASVTQIFKIE